MRIQLSRLGAVLLALSLVACSGGSDSGDGRTAAAASDTTGADDGAAGGAGRDAPTTVDTTFTGQGSADFCQKYRTYAEGFNRLGEGSTPALRALYANAAQAAKEAVDVAPDEIRADARVVADIFSSLVTALEGVNYDFTRLPQEFVAKFMSTELETASTRLEAYGRNVCRVNR